MLACLACNGPFGSTRAYVNDGHLLLLSMVETKGPEGTLEMYLWVGGVSSLDCEIASSWVYVA